MIMLNEYLHPFDAIEGLLIAILITNQFYNGKNESLNFIAECIEKFTNKRLNEDEVKLFIEKISVFKKFYPQEFLKNFQNFEKEITNFANSKKYPTRLIVNEDENCLLCKKELKEKYYKYYHATVYFFHKAAGLFILFI